MGVCILLGQFAEMLWNDIPTSFVWMELHQVVQIAVVVCYQKVIPHWRKHPNLGIPSQFQVIPTTPTSNLISPVKKGPSEHPAIAAATNGVADASVEEGSLVFETVLLGCKNIIVQADGMADHCEVVQLHNTD